MPCTWRFRTPTTTRVGNRGSAESVTFTVDTTAPTVSSAAVDGASLTITFDENLAAAANLANSAFEVKKTPTSGSEETVTLSGSPSISGATVTLTLAAAAVHDDTAVKVSYTKPTSGSDNTLKDAAGNEAASFTGQAVTNNTQAGILAPDFSPADGDTETDNTTNITLTFPAAIKKDDSGTDFGNADLVSILTLKTPNADGTDIPYSASINSGKTQITINPTSSLADGAVYVAISNAYYDGQGNQGSAESATFTVDATAPSPTFSPADTDAVKDVGANITLTFEEAIRKDDSGSDFNASELASILTLRENDENGNAITFSAEIDSEKKVITIDPTSNLAEGAVYVAISNAYYDDAGNQGDAASATFAVDTTAPSPDFSPADGGTLRDASANITLTFAEAIRKTATGTALADGDLSAILTLKVTNDQGNTIDYSATIDAAKKVITIDPANNLSDGTVYVAISDGYYDVAGNQGDAANATFTVDTSAPTVTLVLSDSSISESGGSSTVTATLSWASSAAVTVTVSASPVSPAVDGDFDLSSNTTLSFTAGSTTSAGAVTITAVDNDVDAPNKSITVSGAATGGDVSNPADQTLTITDDESTPTVALALDNSSISENGGSSTVTATLSGASSEAVTVTVSASPVSPAVAGDFTLSTNTELSIAAGATSSTGTAVTITAVDNSVDAANKTVTVSGTANGGGVADPANKTLTITDDDTAGVTVSDATLSVAVGSTSTYTLVLDSEPTGNVTVTPTSGTTANATVNPASVTFAPSNWNTAKEITVTGVQAGNSTVTHAVTASADSNYPTSLGIDSVTVTVTSQPVVPMPMSPDTLVSNLGQTAWTGTLHTHEFVHSQQFTTGDSANGYILSSIETRIDTNVTETGRDTIRAGLWSSQSNAPNTKIQDLSVPAHPINKGTVSFAAPANTKLEPSTSYFFVLYTTTNYALDLQYSNSGSEDDSSAANWSIRDVNTPCSGQNEPPCTSWGSDSNGPLFIRVTGTAVPVLSPTFTPADTATVTDADTNITLTFDEAIKKDGDGADFSGHSDLASILSLKKNDGNGDDIAYSATINSAKTMITIDPSASLDDGNVYVAITSGYYNAGGDQGTAASATFTVDATAPSPTFTPADTDAVKDVGANITLTFEEAIRKDASGSDFNASELASILTLRETDENGTLIAFGVEIDSEKKVITIDPTQDLAQGAVYVAISNAYHDDAGNQGDAASATFTVDTTAPSPSFSPGGGEATNDVGGNITLTFTEAIRKDAAGTELTNDDLSGILTLKSTDSGGTAIGYSAAINDAKTVITIDPTSNLSEGAVYVAISNGYFDRAGNQGEETNATFTVDTTGVSAPTFSPGNGEATKDVATNITLTFTEAIKQSDGAEFTTDAQLKEILTLKEDNSGGDDIAYTASIDGAKKVITVNPDSSLAEGTVYVAISTGYYDAVANAGTAASATFTVDTTAPTVSSAAVDGTSLTITFDENLAAAANLANSAFEVKKTPALGSEETVTLSGSPSISGATVTLTLAAAAAHDDTAVKVSYTKPTSGSDNTLKDAAGNETVSFTGQAVTNNTQAPDAPFALQLSTSAANDTAGEDDGTVTVTATLNRPMISGEVTVALVAGSGTTAAASDDYTLPSAFTIAAGQTTATASVTLVDDERVEDSEDLALTATVSGVTVTGVTLTITDDDAAAAKIAFGTAAAATVKYAASVEEGVTGGTLNVPVTISHLPASSTRFAVEVLDTGTAVEGADYSIAMKTVTFGPSDTNKTKNVAVTITNDSTMELDETIELRIQAADDPANDLGDHYARDDNGALATLTIRNDAADTTLPPPPPTPAAPGALVSNFGQLRSGSDHWFATGTVAGTVYAQGFTTGSHADGYTLSGIEAKFRNGVGGALNAQEAGKVGAELWSSTTGELPNEKIADLTVPSSIGAGTASFTDTGTRILDASTTYFLVLYANDPTNTVGQNLLVDSTIRTDEDAGASTGWSIANTYVTITNSYTPSGSWANPVTQVPLYITVKGAAVILPPSTLELSTSAANDTAGEDDGTVTVTATLNRPVISGQVTVALAAGSGTTAAASDDYTLPSALTIGAGETTATASVTLMDDEQVEDSEELALTATVSGLTVTGVMLTITDDDAEAAKIAFGPDAAATVKYTVSVDEDITGGTLNVPVTVSHLPASSTTFAVEVLDTGTALEGADYSIAAKTVKFGPADTDKTKNVAVTITDDTPFEPDEMIELRIQAADDPANDLGDHYARHAASSTATVTIDSEDVDISALVFSPADGDTETDNTTNITLTFPEAIKKDGSGTDFVNNDLASILTLKTPNAGGTDIPYSASINSGKTVITIDPTSSLADGAVYVAISNAYYDGQGNQGGAKDATFTVDATGVSAPAFSPGNEEATKDAATDITLTFTEAIKRSDGTDFSTDAHLKEILTLKENDSGGNDIDYTASINDAKTVITINPTSDLAEGAVYVAISAGYYDAASNAGTEASATFTVDTTPPSPEFSPGNRAATKEASGNITLTFAEAIRKDDSGTALTDSDLSSILMLKTTDDQGTPIAYTASIDGAKKVITIDPNSNLADGSVYVAISNSYYDTAGNQGEAASATFTVDATAPTVSSAAVDGASLTITFDENLAAAANLANSAFEVKKTPASGSEEMVTLSGSPSIRGATVRLTLGAAVANDDTAVKVSYTKPASGNDNTLKDAVGNEVANFTGQAVTNNTAVPGAALKSLAGSTSTDGSTFTGVLDIGTFASGRKAYTATVAKDVTHVKLTPAVNRTDATVRLGKRGTTLAPVTSGSESAAIPLSTGANIIDLKVTAQGGTQTYTVTVTRQAAPLVIPTAPSALVSNVGQSGTTVPHWLATGDSGRITYAQGFTTGSHADGYTLAGIDAVFMTPFGTLNASDTGTIRAELWSATSAGLPDEKITDLTVPTSISTGTVSFTVTGERLLDASKTYFLVLYTTSQAVGQKTRVVPADSSAEDSGASTGWSISDTHARGSWTGGLSIPAENRREGQRAHPAAVHAGAQHFSRETTPRGRTMAR